MENARGRRSEVGGRRAGVRGRRSEFRSQRLEVGDRRAEIGGPRPKVKDKIIKAEVRDQGSEAKNKVTNKFDIKIKDTFDLIRKIQNNELPDKIMINVHPQRWNDAFVPWAKELVWQNVKNVVKKGIVKFRNSRI